MTYTGGKYIERFTTIPNVKTMEFSYTKKYLCPIIQLHALGDHGNILRDRVDR